MLARTNEQINVAISLVNLLLAKLEGATRGIVRKVPAILASPFSHHVEVSKLGLPV